MGYHITEDYEREYTPWIEIGWEVLDERGAFSGMKVRAYRNKGGTDNWRWDIETDRGLGKTHAISSAEVHIDDRLFPTPEAALQNCIDWIGENISLYLGFLVLAPSLK